MTFAAAAIVFLLGCIAIGSRAPRADRTLVALGLAIVMVLAQLALLRS